MFALAFTSLAIAFVFYVAGCPIPTGLFAAFALLIVLRGNK